MENLKPLDILKDNESIEEPSSILKIILQRHGPKLSASGEKNAKALYFGESVEAGFDDMDLSEGSGLVHISTSPVQRGVDTAKIDLNKLSKTEHRQKDNIKQNTALEVPFQPSGEAPEEKYAHDLELIVQMQKEIEPSVRKDVESEFNELPEQDLEAEIRNRIDTQVLNVLFDSEKSSVKGFQTSYEELADNLAVRYEGFLRHTDLLKAQRGSKENVLQPEDEPYAQIDISHSFPIMSYLKKYLVFGDGVAAYVLSPEEFFERTDGVIRESDSIEMNYVEGVDGYEIKVHSKFFDGSIKFD